MAVRPDIVMERLSSPQLRVAIAEGMTTAVVACGAVEQHGPHLPLFVDAEHGDHLAVEVARRLGNALAAPTIRVGCSEHHMSFSGTVSIRSETFRAICIDYCTSLARHGFERICFLPSHGGNFQPLRDALPDLNAAAGEQCRVTAFTDLVAVMHVWRAAVEAESGLGDRVGGHADIAESSIMLYLHPDLVHQDAAAAGYQPAFEDDVFARIIREGFDSVTPNGILGDARGMTAAIGERCVAALADEIAAFFAEN